MTYLSAEFVAKHKLQFSCDNMKQARQSIPETLKNTHASVKTNVF